MANVAPGFPWDEALEKGRTHPKLVAKLEEKYNQLTAQLLGALDNADAQAKVLELLRRWQPSGPPN
jgi:hypothetical protein